KPAQQTEVPARPPGQAPPSPSPPRRSMDQLSEFSPADTFVCTDSEESSKAKSGKNTPDDTMLAPRKPPATSPEQCLLQQPFAPVCWQPLAKESGDVDGRSPQTKQSPRLG